MGEEEELDSVGLRSTSGSFVSSLDLEKKKKEQEC
jgi:hypothetical protein